MKNFCKIFLILLYIIIFPAVFFADENTLVFSPEKLDFYKSANENGSQLEKLAWDEIIIPSKEGAKVYAVLKTEGLFKFENLVYKIKVFRQDDYLNGKGTRFKTIELRQTENINEFIGTLFFAGSTASAIDDKQKVTINIPQGDDSVSEVCSAEGSPDGGWDAVYFTEKLLKKGYSDRGHAAPLSASDEGTAEEHENEGLPVLNNEFIQSGGVEKIIIDACSDNNDKRPYYITAEEWRSPGFNPLKDWLLVKNQADIFYYSMHGEHESVGTIISKVMSNYWKMAKKWTSLLVPKKTFYMLDDIFYRDVNDEIGENWNYDLEWIFLAGCSALDYGGEVNAQWANFHHKKYNHMYDSRPGLFWAKNLLNKDSNIHGIIGFGATGKADYKTIDEIFNYNDLIVKGWINNKSVQNIFVSASILYHPECENDSFSSLDDSNPKTDKLKYWYSYIPTAYAFPEKERTSEVKPVDLNINTPRAPDYLMIENLSCLVPEKNEKDIYLFRYYPAYYKERKNIAKKRIEIKNLTPLLSFGYFAPYPQVKIAESEDIFFVINPGVIDFENNNMKNYGTNFDGIDDDIISRWNIQLFNNAKILLIDEMFESKLEKSDKPNLLREASYQIKPEKKLKPNNIYYFRVRAENKNNLWSPWSRIQWFKTL